MQASSQDFTQLIQQTQSAHRLCVGFYQRLLPIMKEIAQSLKCEFWDWSTLETDLPSKPHKQPADKWAWDMLPMFASQHAYLRTAGKVASVGDFSILFDVYFDENIKAAKRKQLGIKGEPNPVTLQVGEAVVEISLYRCICENGKSFEAGWENCDEPDPATLGWQMVSENMSAVVLRKTLASLISDPKKITEELQAVLLDAPMSASK
jgi:hypothetical protein